MQLGRREQIENIFFVALFFVQVLVPHTVIAHCGCAVEHQPHENLGDTPFWVSAVLDQTHQVPVQALKTIHPAHPRRSPANTLLRDVNEPVQEYAPLSLRQLGTHVVDLVFYL